MERLYVEEERWESEGERLREEADQLREKLSREVEAAQAEVSSFFVISQNNYFLILNLIRQNKNESSTRVRRSAWWSQ